MAAASRLAPYPPRDGQQPLFGVSGGGASWIEVGNPDAGIVRAGSATAGKGWRGLVDRDKVSTVDVDLRSIVHPLLELFAFQLDIADSRRAVVSHGSEVVDEQG